MNTWLEALRGGDFGADFESAGDARAEARAAANETIIAPLVHFGLIRAEGPDAGGFLHNLLSNDVNGLGDNDLRRAALCTPKGRMLADFLLWRDAEGVTLQLSADLLPVILKKLSMYVLRAKVKLRDASGEFARIGVAGTNAKGLLERQGLPRPEPMQQLAFDAGRVLGLGQRHYEILVDATQAADLWQNLRAGAQPVGVAAWRGLDIAAGIPLITAATMEEFVPQMVNFEVIGGVGFKKGCYPGQEIVARTQYLGKIKRRMFRAHANAGQSAPATPVYAAETGDQACGAVVLSAPSAEGGTDLLVVAQANCVAAGEIRLESLTGPVLQILSLPYTVD